MTNTPSLNSTAPALRKRTDELYREQQQHIAYRTDRMFALLMTLQWVAAVAAARWISPYTWIGSTSEMHYHLWLVVMLGGAITGLPVYLALRAPGQSVTRHVIAIAQVLFSGLLIHITGGRTETHFHVFGSLAFIAIYRDWKVLIPATVFVAADHFFRGFYWPQSIYGVLASSPWRSVEHICWVLFENIFLLTSIHYSVLEMKRIAARTAELELTNESIEHTIEQRTAELRDTAAAARAASEAKSQFLANMSHEIRTPMNGIIGLTDLVLKTNLTQDQRRQLELVETSADSLMAVLNDILDFSKIEAGKLRLENESFDLRDMMGDTLKMFGLDAHKKGLELAFRVQPPVPKLVNTDAARLRQIFVNLVGNAIKFTEQGEILVSAEIEDRQKDRAQIHFTVTDTGIGISEEKQDEIFEPFTQADGSTTRKYGGTGLGLTISLRLIEMMGGRVWIDSQTGEGSQFHFTIECGVPEQVAESRVPEHCVSFEGLRVLIVDDNSTNRLILNEMVQNWRMQPTVVENGDEALEKLLQAEQTGEAFSLVLLDAHMPDIDGFEVAARIQKQLSSSGVTLMMLSSADCDNSYDRCRELGVSSYLVKPLKQSELLDAIVEVLYESKGADQINRIRISPTASLHEISIRPLKVLLAEDNFVNQQLMIRILEGQGHTVFVANNGREAYEHLQQHSVDIVLMDVQMPEMDGMQATAQIRRMEEERPRQTPIIALTAHALKGDREKCLAAGMDAYVSKPIQVKELNAVIAELIGESQIIEGEVAVNLGSSGLAFDKDDLLKRVGDDLDFLGMLVDVFCDDYPAHLQTVNEAIQLRDAERLRSAAHSLKGSASNLGGKRSAEHGLMLENLARESRFDECPPVAEQLTASLLELVQALQQEVANCSV